jgi:hypothetical protein
MGMRARVGLGVLILAAAPAAMVDCFSSSSAGSGPDASFDSTAPDLDTGSPEASEDVTGEPPVEAASEASVEASATPDSGQPEAEAGPPVLEVLAQGIVSPVFIAVDPSFIYVLQSQPASDSGLTSGIVRCPLAGCGASAPTVVVTSTVFPAGIAVSGTTLFWSNSFNSIQSCDVSATLPCAPSTFATLVDDAGGGTFPSQLWVNGSNLYWFMQYGSDRAIETCPVTGCTAGYPKTVLYAGNGATLSGAATAGLAIDGSFAYVSLFSGGPIYRYAMTTAESADLTSETALGGASATPGGAHDLDVDGTTLRWADSSGTVVDGCTTPACSPVFDVATGRVTPYAVRHDATYVYGGDQGAAWNAGTLWRLHK